MTTRNITLPPSPAGFFITGTDTNVGKTIIAACLVRALGGTYWKPIQCGRDEEGKTDSQKVAELAGLPASRVIPEAYCLDQPLSPHQAARESGVYIDRTALTPPPGPTPKPLIVEGAGGVLVPINDQHTMIDVMADLAATLGLAIIVVARAALGTINHSLLTLEAIRARNVPLAGLVFSTPPSPPVRDTIAGFANVTIIGHMPVLPRLDARSLAAAARNVETGPGHIQS